MAYKPTDDGELLTPEEVAEMLKVKLSTVYSWVHQRAIPYFKLGRLVRFTRKQIEEWLQEKQRESQESELQF